MHPYLRVLLCLPLLFLSVRWCSITGTELVKHNSSPVDILLPLTPQSIWLSPSPCRSLRLHLLPISPWSLSCPTPVLLTDWSVSKASCTPRIQASIPAPDAIITSSLCWSVFILSNFLCSPWGGSLMPSVVGNALTLHPFPPYTYYYPSFLHVSSALTSSHMWREVCRFDTNNRSYTC